jgi:lipopolysaccharide transport system ATP-binding protein
MKMKTKIKNVGQMNNSNCSTSQRLNNSTSQQFNKLASHPLTNSSTHPPNKTPIIQVKHLSKRYQIGMDRTYKTLCESITDTIKSPLKRLKSFSRQEESFWALKDINFDVYPGEVVGIIGRNGAGKTTLLKILSRITHPTEGKVILRGRVASLLEVGTGFHPELTGRENVYFNGAILGMTKQEIEDKFDEIVAFSGVKDFLDTPLKRYSSGMQVRLAFAVAAHLEPEILVVDEVLAVGDAEFQKKCLGKMGEVAKEGRTVLFVSHNMAAIENLCQRAIILQQGKVQYIGSQSESIAKYLVSFSDGVSSLKERTDRQGSGEIRVVAIEIRDGEGNILDTVTSGQNIEIYLYFEIQPGISLSRVLVGFTVNTQLGIPIFLQHNRLTQNDFGFIDKNGVFICKIKRLPLPGSTYKIGYSIMPNHGRDGTYYDTMGYAADLVVVDGDFYGSSEVPPITHGVCLVDAQWRMKSGMAVSPVSQ